jgi:hypothetical protein
MSELYESANKRFKELIYYGAEPRDHPNFSWHKYLIRAVAINLIAAAIAWYAINVMFTDMAAHQHHLEDNVPNPHDL